MWQELRICVRSLRTRPGFTATALAILAVAIGANAALFSVVRAVLFESPAAESERLLVMWQQDLERERALIWRATFRRGERQKSIRRTLCAANEEEAGRQSRSNRVGSSTSRA